MARARGVRADPFPAGGKARPLRIALIGWGAIAHRFVDLIEQRNGAAATLCGLCLRRASEGADAPHGVPVITSPACLKAIGADLVIEAAGREAVAEWGEAALTYAPAFVVASASAFCDDALLSRLLAAASRHGSQIILPPGALGGIDALSAAAALGLDEVRHTIVKPPRAWRGTPAEKAIALDAMTERATFFRGTARQAARDYPQNANVAVISALAGLGLDRTEIELVADPAATRNQHRIHAAGDFGTLDVAIESRPLAANPKSSEMTALGLVRLVENRFRTLAR